MSVWLRQPSNQIILLTAIAVAAILGTFGYQYSAAYEAALARAERDLRSAACLLAEHTDRTFEAVEETLGAVARLREDAHAGRVAGDPETLHRYLAAIKGGSNVFKSLGWYGPDGRQVANSISVQPLSISVAQQEHYRVHAEGSAGPGIHVAAPIRSARDGSWIAIVSIGMRDAEGRFAGTVSGAIDPEYFHRVFRGIELGKSLVVTLFRKDGVVMARHPGGEALLGQAPAAQNRQLVLAQTSPRAVSRPGASPTGPSGSSAMRWRWRPVSSSPWR